MTKKTYFLLVYLFAFSFAIGIILVHLNLRHSLGASMNKNDIPFLEDDTSCASKCGGIDDFNPNGNFVLSYNSEISCAKKFHNKLDLRLAKNSKDLSPLKWFINKADLINSTCVDHKKGKIILISTAFKNHETVHQLKLFTDSSTCELYKIEGLCKYITYLEDSLAGE